MPTLLSFFHGCTISMVGVVVSIDEDKDIMYVNTGPVVGLNWVERNEEAFLSSMKLVNTPSPVELLDDIFYEVGNKVFIRGIIGEDGILHAEKDELCKDDSALKAVIFNHGL
ncbi:uncharacterized protein BXZ73DRAFT_85703 [Epithele typhae]|uniref:uncharacterized protein n=1 Tax=Epithele typhae TaxID=378194 RepID=UPI00200881C7|nr:uncharacterized protein BXZ73DRAFT_85703 [Epithele typhae]KAH9900332.1 hypothetical protein BXZ73DRAFT_85703 [Epithele typhae]